MFGRELDGLELAMWLASTFILDTTQSVGCFVVMRQVDLARQKDSALPTWRIGSLSVASLGMKLKTITIEPCESGFASWCGSRSMVLTLQLVLQRPVIVGRRI